VARATLHSWVGMGGSENHGLKNRLKTVRFL
jgi:hypothetical protein